MPDFDFGAFFITSLTNSFEMQRKNERKSKTWDALLLIKIKLWKIVVTFYVRKKYVTCIICFAHVVISSKVITALL